MMKDRKKSPPRIAKWIISRLSYYEKEHALADAIEAEYFDIRDRHGAILSWIWYWFCTVGTLIHYIKFSLLWSMIMFKNYLKITFRTILRHKGYSFINIIGFVLSMTCSFLILLFVLYELSYDRYHENAGEIHRIIKQRSGANFEWWNSTPEILVTKIKEEIPEIIKVTRFRIEEEVVSYCDKQFIEKNFYYGDSQLFEIFSFPFISGDPETSLEDPFSVLITQEASRKYFGRENPIGKVISVGEEKRLYTITGILKDIPYNSHFRFDFLASFKALDHILNWPDWKTSWGANFLKTYILISKNTDPDKIEKKLPLDPRSYRDSSFHIQPLKRIHFYGKCDIGEFESNSDIKYVYLFSAIALFILLIAVSNYMNLTTAKYSLRINEICVRKVVGANRKQLIGQFLGESLIFSFISLVLSIILMYLLLPSFNALIGRNISFSVLSQGVWLFSLFFIMVMIGIISGSYPAFFLSAFHPSRILKGNLNVRSRGSRRFLNYLIVVQFIVSIVLISSLMISSDQLRFMKNRDLGYKKEYIIKLPLKNQSTRKQYGSLKTDLLGYPGILSISASTATPNDVDWIDNPIWQGKNEVEKYSFHRMSVDSDFFDLYDIEFVKGQKPSAHFKNVGYLLNETAVKFIGWEEPIGKTFGFWKLNGTVIGIIKDFHFAHMNTRIGPLAIGINDVNFPPRVLSVKIRSNDVSRTLGNIEKTWKHFDAEYPFEFSFIDDDIEKMYRDDQKLILIFSHFTFIAIFVTCLGSFGLASFTAERRTKEIGIRKVLGASALKISVLLSKEFITLIIIANVIAWPIAYYFMHKWLQNFAYRIALDIWIFIFAGIVALVIALLTVSYQTIKAATANPVDSLRYE